MALYLVATPIGNLEDITLRALRILKEVDLIAAEDTRHSAILLKEYGIQTASTSFHSHSSEAKALALAQEMKAGKNIALITDAGTPGISDPAWSLIQATLRAGVEVIPIPGAAAFLTALMGSGLPMNEFLYRGFIPAKKGRQTLFESLKEEDKTVVLYESPHRLQKTLEQMLGILGPDRNVVLARELTKMHETFHRGTLGELTAQFKTHPPKGEMVILVAPKNFNFSF
ncbi:16S rRNA (cytidine(1402)-2'-O)-methyltransferase [Candidatus Peregrinibacteria bacterium]|nr:MAG: 16S rRNA (cytidine(1402)-2'-O)-methyltransferase [Candidatus Peregrinibacteria bacterium]